MANISKLLESTPLPIDTLVAHKAEPYRRDLKARNLQRTAEKAAEYAALQAEFNRTRRAARTRWEESVRAGQASDTGFADLMDRYAASKESDFYRPVLASPAAPATNAATRASIQRTAPSGTGTSRRLDPISSFVPSDDDADEVAGFYSDSDSDSEPEPARNSNPLAVFSGKNPSDLATYQRISNGPKTGVPNNQPNIEVLENEDYVP
ncbi:hypothetical protein AYI68_g7054 [Smittium mucronatum]|uniref:Uncharacterized protein n=1 Tax=Smittium mucronatum TaxID=133383 RepID=A0A1R0GPS2_9FUNG|nr:hypothetical protein AYI68_g7054 [Smittium mucronatum]